MQRFRLAIPALECEVITLYVRFPSARVECHYAEELLLNSLARLKDVGVSRPKSPRPFL